MRTTVFLLAALVVASTARADCPPDCVLGGGKPATTDCFVQWAGITDATQTCVDGDTTCDTDGKADGVCTLALAPCVNVPSAGCTPAPLTSATVKPTTLPAESALQTTLTGLAGVSTQTCAASSGFAIPLKGGTTLAPIKNGVAKFKVTAIAGAKDVDKLKLSCAPGAQLTRDVQPIFTARCAIPACHSGPSPSGGHTLEAGKTWADNVNVKTTNPANGLRIKPGSIKGSFLARKILGIGIRDGSSFMPQGCPGLPPTCPNNPPGCGGCLTPEETLVILSWIQRGAPND
jgi:hypothetical protein